MIVRLSAAHSSRGLPMPAARVARPPGLTRAWAFGDGSGAGAGVCLLDGGVHGDLFPGGEPVAAYRIADGPDGRRIVADPAATAAADPSRATDHGTACARIVRSLAPACRLVSVRVLGPGLRCAGEDLVTALEWALSQGFAVVNVSMSTRRPDLHEALRHLCDRAYVGGGTTVVAAAHNRAVSSVPWRFPSVISVGSHGVADREHLEVNPEPPVDFFAYGTAPSTGTQPLYGNSFAAANVTGLCARILGAHPKLSAQHVRTVLAAIADNLALPHNGGVHSAPC
ncbi:S8 family serine peptidase [Phytohabitans rumicis]|uniref:Peptidase S8/S53 domain-containing protein n=1 Tax=Phytohabitans rumicis TaxID=1076125 RepID=A0A6V8KZE4_9ACTN|nr:S8 family serine peptidase [Phytohabitans rumicis]GFJ87166.1 hypothetical protein Prum_008080 [Phytohabitans rumicis]